QATPERFRKSYGGAFSIIFGRGLAETGDVEWEMIHNSDRGSWLETNGLLKNKRQHEELPAVFCSPKQGNGNTGVWLSGEGKSALYTADGSLQPAAEKLVKSGTTVVGVDLFYQGEFLKDGNPLTTTPRVKNPREAGFFTFGYNPTLFVDRVRDVVSVVSFLKNQERRPPRRLTVLGLDGAGPWVAAARAQCGESIDLAVIDTGGFRFGKVLDLHDPNFLPGGSKYGDLPALLALGAPGRTWVGGETAEGLTLVQSEYQALKANKNLTQFTGPAPKVRASAIEWLLAEK